MKNSRLKTWIQRFVLRTPFPPFVWLYRLLYALALRCAVCGLRRVPGVRSIYLWRGLTAEASVYGLSDIDLMVLLAEEDSFRPAQACYARLARFLPMLAEEQCHATPVEQLHMEYKYDAVERFRMDTGRPNRRLLFGQDLAADLPPITTAEVRQCAGAELSYVWIVLSGELLGGSLPLFAKRFLIYKMVAEFARLAILAEGAERPATRAEAYRREPQQFAEAAPMLAAIGSWRRTLLSPKPIPTEAVLDCVLGLARRVLSAPLAHPAWRRKVRLPAPNPATARMLLGQQALDAMRRVRGLLPQVCRAILVPRLPLRTYLAMRFKTGRITGGWIDDFVLVLIGGPRPSAEQFGEVTRQIAGFPRQIAAVFQDQGLAIGWAERPEVDFGSRFERPDLFPDLSRTTPLADGLELAGSENWEFAFHNSDHFEVRASLLLARVDSERASVLSLREYLILFWEAGRSALAAAGASQDVVEIPALSDQVADALSAWTPDEAKTIRQLHEEYMLVVQGRPNRADTYKDWIRRYTSRLREMLPVAPPDYPPAAPGSRPD